MSVKASCGHLLTEKEGWGTPISVKGEYFGNTNIVHYLTVCDECLKIYKKEGVILETPKDRDDYLGIKPMTEDMRQDRIRQIDKEIPKLQAERLKLLSKSPKFCQCKEPKPREFITEAFEPYALCDKCTKEVL
jgi:hypothetical protein